MRYWLSIIALLSIGVRAHGAVVADPLTRYVSPDAPVGSPANFTNAVNTFNALSVDGKKRTVQLAPGIYALGHGSFRLHVSNNICIRGAGMYQTTITGSGVQDDPMVQLFDNCEMSDLFLHATNNSANPQLGAVSNSAGDPTSTNVVVTRVRLFGDGDNVWLQTDGGAYSTLLGQYNAVDWTFHDCLFENRYDSVYISSSALPNSDIDGDGWDDTGRTRVRVFNSRLISTGPVADATLAARGEVTNIRVLGATARAEFYGCYIESGGGTNLTVGAFLGSGPSGAESTFKFPGGLYWNNCQVQIFGSNLVSGGVGAWLAQNTNGWIFLNGVQANSNNIVGTGTNYWVPSLAAPFTNSYTGTNVIVSLEQKANTLQALVATNSMLLRWTNWVSGKEISLSIYNNTGSNINIAHQAGVRFMGGASNTVNAGKELAVAVKVIGTNISLSFAPQTN